MFKFQKTLIFKNISLWFFFQILKVEKKLSITNKEIKRKKWKKRQQKQKQKKEYERPMGRATRGHAGVCGTRMGPLNAIKCTHPLTHELLKTNREDSLLESFLTSLFNTWCNFWCLFYTSSIWYTSSFWQLMVLLGHLKGRLCSWCISWPKKMQYIYLAMVNPICNS
jgi:hypothetical protein